MAPEDIDRILAQAAGRTESHGVNPAVIGRAKAAILEKLAPVRPIAPPWVFSSAFLAVFAAISLLAAWLLGMRGLRVLSGIERAVIFPVLVASAAIAAVGSTREMRPAAGRRIGAIALAVSLAALLASFAVLLRDYNTENFVAEGIRCLIAGVVCAIPAAAVMYLFVRRGFVLNLPAAGLAVGTLAGLAGVAMLELHCPILKAPHVMFWHVAVIPVCAFGGLLVGVIAQLAQRSQS